MAGWKSLGLSRWSQLVQLCQHQGVEIDKEGFIISTSQSKKGSKKSTSHLNVSLCWRTTTELARGPRDSTHSMPASGSRKEDLPHWFHLKERVLCLPSDNSIVKTACGFFTPVSANLPTCLDQEKDVLKLLCFALLSVLFLHFPFFGAVGILGSAPGMNLFCPCPIVSVLYHTRRYIRSYSTTVIQVAIWLFDCDNFIARVQIHLISIPVIVVVKYSNRKCYFMQ